MDKNIYLAQFYGKSQNYTQIPREWFPKFGVKRGLRNEDHTGVLVGLTRVADVVGYKRDAEGNKIDCDGILYYRGIDVRTLIEREDYHGFLYEEACFLLLSAICRHGKNSMLSVKSCRAAMTFRMNFWK